MKKLCNILISSLIYGLLLVGYSNAMTYTVEGNNTKIAIPEDKCEGVTIKWCADCDSINFALSTPECTGNTLGGVNHIECTHTYDTNNTYTITVTPTNTYNTYSSIYISDANIKSITNFNGFSNISNLYLNNNQNIEIGNSTFNSLNNGVNIYLENNKLTQYSTNINNISWLSLQHNELTTIPSNIWDARQGNYIELSNEVRYGSASSSTKKFYLSHNNINFVGITKVNNYDTSNCNYYNNYCDFNNETDYNFEWFGYSYNTTPLKYDYEIIGTTIEDTTNSTGVTIREPLNAGSYRFRVCIHGSTEYCDTFDFDVDYDENLNFTSGTYPNSNGTELDSVEDIEFHWNRTGNYPEEFLSGYTFSLIKGTSEAIIPETSPSLSNKDLNSISIPRPSNPNGTYTFTVKLKNYNETIDTIERTFTITIDDTIAIEKPRTSPSYTGAGVATVSVPLKWSTTSSLFNKYSYYITTNNGCSPTNIIKSGDNITEKSFSNSVNLGDGEYYLCITMHASNGDSQGEKKFYVDIPSTIQITSPTDGADITTAETMINWHGFTPYNLINYSYELLDEHSNSIPGAGGTTGNESITYKNLGDGSYTFNVTLNDDSGKSSVSDSISFTISSSAGKYINIISPTAGTHTGYNVTGLNTYFKWEGSGSALFYRYKYTLKKGLETITGGYSSTKTGEFYHTLPSGTYTFYVDMLDSDDNEIISQYRTFKIVIPSRLEINSPSSGLQSTNNIVFDWTGFAEFFNYYEYTLKKLDGGATTIKSGTGNEEFTGFNIAGLHHGTYTFTIYIKNSSAETIEEKEVSFRILDDQDLITTITSNDTTITEGSTIASRTATFTRDGRSEDFSGYYYAITGITFTGGEYNYSGTSFGNTEGSITLDNLVTGKYKFTVKMLSGPDKDNDVITGATKDFNVAIPASLTILTPSEGAKIQSSTATISWTGYNDTEPLYSYMIKKGSTVLDTSNLTDNTSFTRSDLSNGSYSVTVYMLSGWAEVATKTVNFTVDIPVKSSGGSSSKSHPTNNLKLSIGNDSPSSNEWIELIVKIDEKYTGKVTFPKIQYYSGSKWVDIPVTSKNYISDYSDDAKLGYIKFSSDDEGNKTLSQFIKFSKNGNYRIYAEDKDGYDTYVQFKIGPKNVEVNTGEVHSAAPDTEEEIYIARSCKKYTIIYSDTLNIYTSPNLNISEFFMNKDYLKRYLDSKNRRQSGCPTNVGWISNSYLDRTNDDERYTAPNGKVYFIVGEEGDYYSNELNRELKTPTSFRSIQELKYYIRDRNPLINMAALGPVN